MRSYDLQWQADKGEFRVNERFNKYRDTAGMEQGRESSTSRHDDTYLHSKAGSHPPPPFSRQATPLETQTP